MKKKMASSQEDQMGSVAIFGATGGIGSELCHRLLRDGRRIFLVGHSQDKLEALALDTGMKGIAIDATQPDEVKRAFETAYREVGPIQGVVNCVGA